MAELLYNGHSQSVCLDEVSIQRAGIQHPATHQIIGHKETWSIQATLIGDTTSLLTQMTALAAAYASDRHDLTLKTAPSGTVLHQMPTASAAEGVRITGRPSFPTLKNAELVTKRGYTITAEADFYDANPTLLVDDQKWSYQIGQDGKCTRTLTGRLETKLGTSALGLFASKAPSLPAGYTRGPKSKEINHDDTEMSYSYADREHWVGLPAGVLDGSYTTTTAKQGNDSTITVAGRWVGPAGAVLAAVNALRRPALRQISENVVAEPFGGATSFTFVYENRSGTLEFSETVTITPSRERQIYHEILGGGQAVRQTGSKTTARASVSGRAVGASQYPTFPDFLWPEMYVVAGGESKTWESPVTGPDGRTMKYAISWRHEFEFPLNLNTRLPRVR